MTLIMVLLAAVAAAPAGDVEVVQQLYRFVVQNHPVGIPSDDGMRTIGPLVSSRAKAILDAGRACEADYYRVAKGTLGDGKPEFGWLEWGLFSGGNENAGPVEFRIVKVVPAASDTRGVLVELTYRDTSETYCCGKPPDPRNTYRWRVTVLVKTEGGRSVVDDVVHDPEGTDSSRWRLSTSFKGCAGTRWIGVRPR